MSKVQQDVPLSQRWLDRIERTGNRLPHPVVLFIYFCAIVVLLSAWLTATGANVQNPSSGEWLYTRSLLSRDGLLWMLHNAVGNFVSFAPVGSVIVAIMGIAVAEHSGLLGHVLTQFARRAPPKALSAVIVFTGVLSSIGFDSGYVVLIPLAAIVFRAAGRSPLAGIAAAFAGVSGGFSANILLGPVDAILAGISTESLQLIDPQASVSVSANYYFIAFSTLLITLVGAWVTETLVEPRLQRPGQTESTSTLPEASASETKALRRVLLFSVLYVAALIAAVVHPQGPLRNPDLSGMAALPLLQGIVVFIAAYGALAGIIFGYSSGRFTRSKDWVDAMESGMSTLAGYLVLMFFAAQFVNYFSWTGIGALTAIKGAQWLAGLELSTTSLLISFVLCSAAINLLIGSASAKWVLMAPIFVPMLAMLDVAPEAVQMAYRIGDSSTNIITPLMPYFGVVVAFMQRHDSKAGMGTLLALMLPYSLCFIVSWSVLLAAWVGLGIPLGPK
ncbi:AbgT family transporter [Spongiibacter marinus]|uniref:AbgT family transporter n=1 Tax=Spongiibacter marinus TaxID=354246 RepID=UPI003561D94C